MKFDQRQEAVFFLVQQGKPQNLARAAIDQGYNYEADGDTRDLLWRATDEEDYDANMADRLPGDENTEFQPTYATDHDILAMYNTFEEMLEVTEHGIEMEGELMYDLEGKPLPNYGQRA